MLTSTHDWMKSKAHEEKTGPPKLTKLPAAKQRRLDELLEKNSEGAITGSEKSKLEQLVAEAEQLMVSNAQRINRSAAL